MISSEHKMIGMIGSRRRTSYTDFEKCEKAFLSVYEKGDWLVSGGCPKGGDAFAEKIAKDRGLPILIFYPVWNGKGKGAGFARNGDIAKHSDIVIACVAEDRTGGTEDTIKKFLQKPDVSEDKVILV